MSAISVSQGIKIVEKDSTEVSPKTDDIVIGLVGYAGSGLERIAVKLNASFVSLGYKLEQIKISNIIEQWFGVEKEVSPNLTERGRIALRRARNLQDLGDKIRELHGVEALASLAVRRITLIKSKQVPRVPTVYLVDSLKHKGEVDLLRQVYDQSFYLLAVHCEEKAREGQLLGALDNSSAKFAGAENADVKAFMDRDAKDSSVAWGQQVREVFWLGDYFLDNSSKDAESFLIAQQIKRFSEIVLGIGWPRPSPDEEGMYLAFGAAKRSACLSRQVGAALQNEQGETISVGSNDVPKFGGGTYSSADANDERCYKWTFDDVAGKFVGCHNDRKKRSLEKEIGKWLGERLSEKFAALAHPVATEGVDVAKKAREEAEQRIRNFFKNESHQLERIPGLKEVIEYSRSIHAEMNALLSAARSGRSTEKTKLYCTTFPCHNCARHLVAAGVTAVYYVEPYVKSLAYELHSDSISLEPPKPAPAQQDRMTILPFVGVGPALYDKVFHKRLEVKAPDGRYIAPATAKPIDGVRLLELTQVEERAIKLVPERRAPTP